MVGKYSEKDFDINNYEEFYEDHSFAPAPDDLALDIHEVTPRFGWAFDQVEKHEPAHLLDLGCLDGSFALTIARHFDTEAWGVDLSKHGIKLAKKRARANGLDHITHFEQRTIESALQEYADEGIRFGMITAFEVLEHVKDPKSLLALIDEVLELDGNVLISTPSAESPLYGLDDEKNKCHIRLYTTEDKDYEAENKYGHKRKATSIAREIGKYRIQEMSVHNHLINLRYQ